ncbi:MAG: murein biosynthesis integral membrane protein MurJ, partial [Deinococcus sp.]|nr:murein biosynthesis integral membrane protein MurJ [Deinococcus sp.]
RELLAEGALVSGFIPVYQTLDRRAARVFLRAATGALLAVNTLVVGLGILLAPAIVDLLTTRVHFSAQQAALAVVLTRIMFPFLGFISLAALAMGVLNAGERPAAFALAPVAFNLAAILVVLERNVLPIPDLALGWAWTIGGVVQFAFQLPALARLGSLMWPSFRWHKALGRVVRLMAPTALTTSARQVSNVLLNRLATTASLGAVTVLFNADTVFQLVLSLGAVSPAMAFFPRMSSAAAQGDLEGLRRHLTDGLRLLNFLLMPAAVLLIILSRPTVDLIFLGGEFTAQEALRTARALVAYSTGLLPWGLLMLLNRSYFARQLVTAPVLVSTSAFASNIVLFHLLITPLGEVGLALSTAISGWLALLAMLFWVHRDLHLNLRTLGSHSARLVLATLALALACELAARLPSPAGTLGTLAQLTIASGAGGVAYLAVCLALGVKEAQRLLRRR